MSFFMSKVRGYFKKHYYHFAWLLFFLLITWVTGYFTFTENTRLRSTSDRQAAETLGLNESVDYSTQLDTNVYTNVHIQQDSAVNIDVLAKNSRESVDYSTQSDQVESEKEKKVVKSVISDVSLVISGVNYDSDVVSGVSVEQMMRTAGSNKDDLSFEFKDFGGSLGSFVQGINGIETDNRKGLYWIYYINDEKAHVGISNYILQPGDNIEWKYESSTY
jgi:hypothetical protein